MAILSSTNNPSFSLFPVNNDRTGWRPFGLPVIMVVPNRRDGTGLAIANSQVFNVRIYIEDVPREARVAGHDHVGLRFPDRELFSETIDSFGLADRIIDPSGYSFTHNGQEIDYSEAVKGDLFTYTTSTGVSDTITYLPGANYYDLSDILIDFEHLPSDQYNLVYQSEYFSRLISTDGSEELICTDATRTSLALLRFNVKHPGEVLEEFERLTPPPYLTNATRSKDTTLALYRPFTDILQDIMDEQDLLESVNWVFDTPAEAIPYLSQLLGWDLPYFPESLDKLRRAVLRRTVEFQNLAGSRRAIINLFRLFGFEILISNLWWSSDGKRLIRPDERLPFSYEDEEITTIERSQINAILSEYNDDGFGVFEIPLIYRPQEQSGLDSFTSLRDGGDLTVDCYFVEVGSPAYDELLAISQETQDNPSDYGDNSGGNGVDSNGFLIPIDINNRMLGLETIGHSQVLVSGKMGLSTDEILVGPEIPLKKEGVSLNRDSNILSIVLNGALDFEGRMANTPRVVFAFVIYKRQEFIVPDIIKDIQSNRFDIQVITGDLTELADPVFLDFAIEFLFRLKAFHSLLNRIIFSIELNETYEVTDWCVPPETMITVFDGTAKRIDSLHPGDVVIGEDGKQHKILKTKKRLISENINRISAIGVGDDLLITGEHPLLIAKFENVGIVKHKNPPHRSSVKYRDIIKEDFEWISSDSISPNDLAYAPFIDFNITHTNLTDTEIEFLGYYAAEGDARISTCCVRFSLGEEENLFADRICQLGLLLNASSTTIKNNDRGGKSVEVYGKHLVEFCQKAVPGKAVNKYLSNTILSLDCTRFKYFFLSYVKGDGSYSGGAADRIQCTSASRNLIEQLYWKLTSIDINCTKWYGIQKGGPHNRETICYQHRLTLPKNSHDKLLKNDGPNNAKLRHWICQDNISIKIKSITKEFYSGYVYNLEVENNNTYIANGIVVHNCVGGDITQRFDTDAGTLQVPPAIIPDLPNDINDCSRLDPETLGYKDEDIILRLRKLANLPEEHAIWRSLDARADQPNGSTRLALMDAAPGRDACKFTHRGQDRVVGERVELRTTQIGPSPNSSSMVVGFGNNSEASPVDLADNGEFSTTGPKTSSNNDSSGFGSFTREYTDIRQPHCDTDGITDYCYKGRADDELLYRPTIVAGENIVCKPCSIDLGVGVYYLFPTNSIMVVKGVRKPCPGSLTEYSQFSGQASGGNQQHHLNSIQNAYLTAPYDRPLEKNSHLARLLRDYDTPTEETLHYTNRIGESNGDQRFNLAIQRPSLNIEKPTLHLPGCRFPRLNALVNDFYHPEWDARPWDDDFSTHCGPKFICGTNEPTFLNCVKTIGSDGNEYLVFDVQPFQVLGNNLIPDIQSLGDHTLGIDALFVENDVIHRVYMKDADAKEAITFDGVCDYDTSVSGDGTITVSSPIFASHNTCNTGDIIDFADGYACEAGELPYSGDDIGRSGLYDEVFEALGLPSLSGTGAPATLLIFLNSGILAETGLRLDCGCLLVDCDGTAEEGSTICSASDYIDQDGYYDWNCDHIQVDRVMRLEEPMGACSIQLDGTIPCLLELIV